MTGAATPSAPSPVRRLLLPAVCSLLLALAMMRLPVVTDVEPAAAYRTLLYETLRLGHPWADTGAVDGPLAAVQTPAYLGGSIWMAVTWQSAGNLWLAGVLVAAAFRLPWSRRGWALGLLAVLLSRWPACAPWLVMLWLGHGLVRDWAREPRGVIAPALALGFLSLFSLGHLLLGALAVAICLLTPRPPPARVGTLLGFVLGLAGGWLVVGQALPELGHWLARGFPLLAVTSPLDRFTEIGSMAGWAAATALAFLGLVLGRRDGRPVAFFLLGAAWLAWKTVALQPNGHPAVFFATVILGSFVLWQQGARTGWVALPAALAIAGLAGSQPGFFTDALGHFDRQIVFNVRQLASLGQLRPGLAAQVRGLRQGHAWPQIQAAVGTAPVGTLGDALPRALLNNLALAPRNLVAPPFVIQGLPASAELAPALVDPSAQGLLYRDYELQLAEKGFLLWRRKTGIEVPPTPLRAAEGTLRFNQPLALPTAKNTAYQVEVQLHRSWLGWLWSLVDEVPAPGLVVKDESGLVLRYALPPEAAAHGFLVDPLVRGNVEFAQWQAGQNPVRTAAITIAPPPGWAWLWSDTFAYRLDAVADLALTSRKLPDPAGQYAPFNRLPLGTAQAIPFGVTEVAPGDPVLFAHPASLVEFAVRGTDHRVHGSFGLLPGAYQGAGATDGVDFSVEFVGTNGRHEILYHRHLNPRDELADRGTQHFSVDLPSRDDGRLLLRTWNPPYRTAAWDWAFWRKVVIE